MGKGSGGARTTALGEQIQGCIEALIGAHRGEMGDGEVARQISMAPEDQATLCALRDAARWQRARAAVGASAGGREHPQGLGWEEI